MPSKQMNRRDALKIGLSSMAYYSTLATTPNWIIKSSHAVPLGNGSDDRILVILQHGGGIDGLNTVIPRSDDRYYDSELRPNLHVPRGSDINLDGLNGLHPKLADLADWYQKGALSVVQNVGYINPNLSHFSSTDIYEYGQNPYEGRNNVGWVGRFFDNECEGAELIDPLAMVASGTNKVPDALGGLSYFIPPAIKRPSDYQFDANEDRELRLRAIERLARIETLDPQLDFLQRSINVAEASVRDIAEVEELETLVPEDSYSGDKLGRGLKLVSKIIRAGFGTRIFYVSQGGYDTHANQIDASAPLEQGSHPRLLGRFNDSVHAFLTEMERSGNLDRVLLMTFSEFGRRVKENGSMGTDHGAANSLFLFGGGVEAGVYGGQPDLENLVKGNLRHTIDFRSVYARVIESWFGSDASASVFGEDLYRQTIARELRQIPFISDPADPTNVAQWNLH